MAYPVISASLERRSPTLWPLSPDEQSSAQCAAADTRNDGTPGHPVIRRTAQELTDGVPDKA